MFRFFPKLAKSQYRSLQKMSTDIKVLKEIFQKSVEAVQPHNLIKNQVNVTERHLYIQGQKYPLHKPCYVAGFGKAVLGMALELERILQDKLQMGIVTVPEGIMNKFKVCSKIRFIEGATNNIPDEAALKGALEIKSLVEGLKEDDLLLVLISGGGSALLPLPKPPISLQEKQSLIKGLSLKGANILELNCVRKEISVLKGGGLAELAFPAKVAALVLSDVVGDPLDVIASGPTVPNVGAMKAVEIIRKYGCYEGLPESVKQALKREKETTEIPVENGQYKHVDNYIIGNNLLAARAAKTFASSLALQSSILSTSVQGNVSKLSQIYGDLARNISNSSSKQTLLDFLQACDLEIRADCLTEILAFDFSKTICLIAAGEPIVVVKGGGKGGRNQQLALELSLQLNKLNIKSADISFLSAGTDGIDGPTDAAGAIATLDLVHNCLAEGLRPEEYLNNNDAYSFFQKYRGGEALVQVGHTGTNVMDIHVMIIRPK